MLSPMTSRVAYVPAVAASTINAAAPYGTIPAHTDAAGGIDALVSLTTQVVLDERHRILTHTLRRNIGTWWPL
jgi:hypothetical protein